MPSTFASSTATVFLTVLGIRLLNALTLSTFFQPDEYFQSLEVAASWRPDSPSYVTWEWHHGLRSVLYPRVFQAVYLVVDAVSHTLGLSPAVNAELLVVAPKVIGAVTAAVGDLYTGLLARKLWGDGAGNYALLFSICSAWNWFCFTRTFSNCLETTLTVIGMSYWPWRSFNARDLSLASLFAAISFTVRPTNGLISWAIGALLLEKLPSLKGQATAVYQIGIISGAVLLVNAAIDYGFYNRITFPFVEFYRLNVTQSISEFYGVSPWHYYYSQGMPLLLTGYLPLALFSLYKGLLSSNSSVRHLTVLANFVPLAFMITKHKEVRFLYPLLPMFHALMAGVGLPALPRNWNRKWVVSAMVIINLPIAYYTGYIHQRGVVDVVNWLRVEHYSDHQSQVERPSSAARIGFLMPCHSTPFGSHLWNAALKSKAGEQTMSAWFLTCEPPVGLSIEERKEYLDEADQFYANATMWLAEKFGPPPMKVDEAVVEPETLWPDKLITFEATAELIKGYLLVEEKIGRITNYLLRTNVQLGASYATGIKSNELVAAGLIASAKFVNADPGEVVLGGSSTQLLHNLSSALVFPPGSEIIVTNCEHETNVAPWLRLARLQGHTIKHWSLDSSKGWTLHFSDLEPLLSEKTALVAFTNCSNITGTIHDVKAIARSIKQKNPEILVSVDGVAYAPHRPIDVKDLGIDFYVFSWYKVYGPHISLLYAAPRTSKYITPLAHFFNPQETLFDKLNLAGGNYELTAALPKLVEFLTPEVWEEIAKQEEVLSKTMIDWLSTRRDATLYGTAESSSDKRVPVISFSIKGWGSKELVEGLEKQDQKYGIRWGHCYAKRLIDSFGLDKPDEGVVRVSLLFYNTVEEVEGLVKVLEQVLDTKK
ncbi:hypothetical protein DRE_04427 [Drechslerella stenobrocha 248]|uniref:Mannosyltransferase n=1 Tax=Drechslerella stenobrocha 248 TaxID=1043628 RepID=W7HQ27_9PEZI|nr:hypothetical protein DRE_04427 [Drechslerella stenobrocha 248]